MRVRGLKRELTGDEMAGCGMAAGVRACVSVCVLSERVPPKTRRKRLCGPRENEERDCQGQFPAGKGTK